MNERSGFGTHHRKPNISMDTEYALLMFFTGTLLGIMLFFAAAVAPTVFRSLPAEHAASYLRGIFPVYYTWGIILALVISLIAYDTNIIVFVISSIITVLFIYSRQGLLPGINLAREARLAGAPDGEAAFKRLHRLSVLINLGNMLLLIISAVLILKNL
jgi:hypothetical protein